MRKNIAEEKEKLKEKLEYIGLNLEKIPKFLTEVTPISFKPLKTYTDTTYKVYKYIDVKDITILLSPTDRLTNLTEKYKKSTHIVNYLDSKTQKNAENFTTFLKMLNDTNLAEIQRIEQEQEKIKQQIPNQVKYEGNYTWQIYYSDVSDKYFMLVPTNEYNNAALFYLIKKQIERRKTRKKELIFVPITYQDYSGEFLLKSHITDIENYLWYYTKEWPNIYEVYDIKGKMQIKIAGQTNVYENIKSNYCITLKNKEQALKMYKLLKALFVLSTAFPDEFNFKTKITNEGSLEFSLKANNVETFVTYESLAKFVQNEATKRKMLINLEEKKIQQANENLQNLKETIEKQTTEYLSKQRQISTFLECKKTFFGKVKFYFSSRKKDLKPISSENTVETKTTKNEIKLKTEQQVKENNLYTIEDLIEICTKLDARQKMAKSLIADQKALELKKINLERKIKNANIYLNEIELHKKSIFEFWKFSNKDELPSLNEGEEEEKNIKEKIGKSFNYENDIEEFGKKVDELQRRKLSKNETDAVYAIKQDLKSAQILYNTKSDKLTEKQLKTIEQQFNKLKQEYENNIKTVNEEDFNVFGAIVEEIDKTKEINNVKHRENEKNKYNVLNISKQANVELYIDTLRNYINLVKEAFRKIITTQNVPAYITSTKQLESKNINILHLDINKAILQNIEKEEIYLYKVNLKEETQVLYYSNIIFYENANQTLPVGMNLSDEILIDLKKHKPIKVKQDDFKINYLQDDYTSKIIAVHCIEYELA